MGSAWSRGLLWLPGLLAGCDSLGSGPCERLALTLCDECDVGDSTEDTLCACLEDGEVDNADRYFSSDDDAEQWCFRTHQEVTNQYLTHEERAECRQDLDFFKEFGDDVCETWGYKSSGGHDSGNIGNWDWDSDADVDADADADADADPSVSISWPSDATLSVTTSNFSAGVLGIAETGSGSSGWYHEDCVTGSYCKVVYEGVNEFQSVHPDVGGEGLDGMNNETTLFHGGLHPLLTFAVWDVTDECVHCSGDDCSYYADSGC